MPAETKPSRPMTRGEAMALVLIVAAACALRFPGITHHVVRGAPDFDEQNNFVRPILRMWREGTLDPSVYQGYAGFFNWLAAVPVMLGDRLSGVPGAYGAARGVSACFGVVNLLLVHALARRLSGPWAGLFAAALLAVSRLDVRAAHHVTPDVLVATGVLGVLLLMARPSARADVGAGLVIGLVTAVKYTGLFAAVPAGAAVLLQGGLLRRAPRIALFALLAFVLAAPFAVRELTERGSRVSGLLHYYGEKAERNREARGDTGGFQGASGWLLQAVGPAGGGLALLALVLGPDRRRLVPAALTVLAGLAAMSAAAYVYPRHVVPPAAALTALAGAGFAAAVSRARRAAPALALGLLAVSLPLQAKDSIKLTRHYLEPSAVDRAAEWVEASLPREALIAASLPRFAVDAERFEVRRLEALDEMPRSALGQFDLVVSDRTDEPEALPGFRVLAQFPNEDRLPGRTVSVLGPPLAERDALRRVMPVASDASVPGLLELHLAEPARVFRVEVEVGTEPGAWPQDLALEARASDGSAWVPLAVAALRPSTDERQRKGAPRGQIFIVTAPTPVTGLRIARSKAGPLNLAEVRVFAREGALPEANPVATRESRPRRRRR